MTELIRMRALKGWRNDSFEGVVNPGQEFDAGSERARELERVELAVRVVGVPAKKPEVEVQTKQPRPLEFGDHRGAVESSSFSRPGQAQPAKNSSKSAGTRKS